MENSTDSGGSPVESLRDRVRGEVLCPDDAEYDTARRVWNGTVDRHPLGIVRCTGVADVGRAVAVARTNDLRLAVKGGGHAIPGHAVCNDGLVLDLSPMDGVRVDPVTERVHVRGGATWGAVNHETRVAGVAVAGSSRPDVGVAGFTLGGGIGPLTRQYGLAADDLAWADVVTADGELVRASESTNTDLFWALRGGGGNFGVVTAMAFETREIPSTVPTGMFTYRFTDAPAVLRTYRDFILEEPAGVGSKVTVYRVDPDAPLSPDPRGDLVISVGVRDLDAGGEERSFRPFRNVADPLAAVVGQRPPKNSDFEVFESGRRNHWKTQFFETLSDEAIDRFVDLAGRLPESTSKVGFMALGGVMSEVDAGATAFPHRNARHILRVTAQWTNPARDDEIEAWVREFHEAMKPYATGGEFVNQQTEGDSERVRAAYRGCYDRLVKVKNEWDPDNLFDGNQNVEPTS